MKIIANQMAIAQKLSKNPVVIDSQTLEMYYEIGEGFVPILSENEFVPYTHFSKKLLLSLNDVIMSENNGILREFNGVLTDVLQKNKQKTNGENTENEQTGNGKFLVDLRKMDRSLTELRVNEVLNKYNLKRFSQRFSGHIKEVAEQIEKLTIVILFNTNKENTVDKVRLLYRNAEHFAQKNKDIELEQLAHKMEAIRSGQLKISAMKESQNKKANAKKIRLIVMLSIMGLITAFLVFGVMLSASSKTNKNKNKTYSSQKFTNEEVKNLITAFCEAKDTTITEWRRNYIIKYFPTDSLITKEEATKIISNMISYKK